MLLRGLSNAAAMVLLMLLMSLAASANVLVASVYDASVVKGQQSSFGLTITNNNSFSIFKVSISSIPDYSFPSIEEIAPFSSYSTSYNLTASFTGSRSFNAVLSWSNKTQGVATPASAEVIINSTSILPNNLTIRRLDSVVWRNMHSSNLTVKASDGEYELSIAPSTTSSRVFGSEGKKGFFVVETGFIGNITIINNTVDIFVHDSSKDIPLAFTANSILPPNTITVSPLISNFSLAFNETIEGVLMLTSQGFISRAILEASKWLVFPENNVSFTSQKILTFRIQPVVNQTQDSGIIHNITIRARSENAPDSYANISVLIAFHNFTIDEQKVNQTLVVLATREQLAAFCRQYPNECPSQNVTQFIYINRTDTEDEVTLRQIREEIERIKNLQREQTSPVLELSTKVDVLSSEVSGVKAGVSGLQQEKRLEKSRSTLKTIVFVVLGLLATIVGGVASFSLIIRKRMIQRRVA